MDQPSKKGFAPAVVLSLLFSTSAAQATSTPCEEAWAAYNEFKARSTMETSQYPLTAQGAAVRSACGEAALPAPADADINPVPPRVKKKPLPPKPPQPSKPPRPPAEPKAP